MYVRCPVGDVAAELFGRAPAVLSKNRRLMPYPCKGATVCPAPWSVSGRRMSSEVMDAVIDAFAQCRDGRVGVPGGV